MSALLLLASSPTGAQVGENQRVAEAHQKRKGDVRPGGTSTPRTVTPRVLTPQHAPRVVNPRITPKFVNPGGGQKVVTPRVFTPKSGPKFVSPKGLPKAITPVGPGARRVTAARLRGVPPAGIGRTVIAGRNFSVWRNPRRVRFGNRWRTFVAISALSAIAIGAATYYPYAYIDAPQPYCQGLTADGCQLMWQELMTLEGDLAYQCVAYCPWQ
jgi:hypothetical protein